VYCSCFTKKIDLETGPLDMSLFSLPNNVIYFLDDVYRCLLALEGAWSIGPYGILGHLLYELETVISFLLGILFR